MPDSVVKNASSSARPASSPRDKTRRAARAAQSALDKEVDTDNKLARAARSTQRLAQLSQTARRAATSDLFVEDAERAALQAMNTDIRQGTLSGFELPEVFMSAVPADAAPVKRNARATASPDAGEIATLEEPKPEPDRAAVAEPDQAGQPAARVDQEPKPAPELDRARITAFADTVDALYAVIADQRRSASAHSRRMKTMLTIILCVLLATVATGVTQTIVLIRMAREGGVQQQRIEQLMLNQQATLASVFDTDSANVSMAGTPHEQASAPAKAEVPARAHAAKRDHRRSGAH